MTLFNLILPLTPHEPNCLFLSGFSTKSSYAVLILPMGNGRLCHAHFIFLDFVTIKHKLCNSLLCNAPRLSVIWFSSGPNTSLNIPFSQLHTCYSLSVRYEVTYPYKTISKNIRFKIWLAVTKNINGNNNDNCNSSNNNLRQTNLRRGFGIDCSHFNGLQFFWADTSWISTMVLGRNSAMRFITMIYTGAWSSTNQILKRQQALCFGLSECHIQIKTVAINQIRKIFWNINFCLQSRDPYAQLELCKTLLKMDITWHNAQSFRGWRQADKWALPPLTSTT